MLQNTYKQHSLAYRTAWWSIVMKLSLFLIPSYFTFVMENNVLTGASFLLYFGLLSFIRKSSRNSRDHLGVTFGGKFESPYNVRVLTYNIFLRPPLIKNNEDDFKNERLAEFLRTEIDRFDIVCLQEMFNLANYRQQLLLQIAREKGFPYYAKSVNPSWFSGKFIDAGLVILSRYPIWETDGMIYRSGNQIDGWAAKQVIYAKVQVTPNYFVHVFTTHMQASYYDNHQSINVINDKARATQVQEMADFIKAKTEISPYPVLITGDFNIDSVQENEEYQYMFNTLKGAKPTVKDLLKEFHNSHPITYGDFFHTPHETEMGKMVPVPRDTVLTHKADYCCGLSIDYIMIADTEENAREKVVEVTDTQVEPFFVDGHKFGQLSDHYGISTTLRINKIDAGRVL